MNRPFLAIVAALWGTAGLVFLLSYLVDLESWTIGAVLGAIGLVAYAIFWYRSRNAPRRRVDPMAKWLTVAAGLLMTGQTLLGVFADGGWVEAVQYASVLGAILLLRRASERLYPPEASTP